MMPKWGMAEKKLTPMEEKTVHIVQLSRKGVSIDDIAESSGIKAETVGKILTAIKKGYGSYESYLAGNLKNRGYETRHVYMKQLQDRKSHTLKARILSGYISGGLERLEKKQVWLADCASLTPMAISQYRRGRSIPGDDNFKKIARVFGDSYNSVDELVMDYVSRIKSSLEKQI